MDKPYILVLSDDPDVCDVIRSIPAITRFKLVVRQEEADWADRIEQTTPDVALLHFQSFTEETYRLLSERNFFPRTELMLVSDGLPNQWVDLTMERGGSFHFRLPLEQAVLEDVFAELADEIQPASTNIQPVKSSLNQFGLLLGSSRPMVRLYRKLRKVAATEASVMFIGESGTGKELAAHTIHILSDRKDAPFIAVNCAAMSADLAESELFGHIKGAFTDAKQDRAGVFEQAEGGTLFLDEVTEMPLDLQAKLLRVLETGEYRRVGSERVRQANVRVVSATNRNPQQAVQDAILREDVYFRLAHIPIELPPLRVRGTDIVELAQHFLAYRNAQEQQLKSIDQAALQRIAEYPWPGNVRELKHTIERAYILAGDCIGVDHLQLDNDAAVPGTPDDDYTIHLDGDTPLHEIERKVIMSTLEALDGNKSQAAAKLGISTKTLYNKLDKYSDEEH